MRPLQGHRGRTRRKKWVGTSGSKVCRPAVGSPQERCWSRPPREGKGPLRQRVSTSRYRPFPGGCVRAGAGAWLPESPSSPRSRGQAWELSLPAEPPIPPPLVWIHVPLQATTLLYCHTTPTKRRIVSKQAGGEGAPCLLIHL